ncbi:hypothetical protein HOC13_01960 [Candidatus Woesearchaeota archaeon]|jgi:hypothetical protein|nr:hypothetical protein [Candidatus Woesearchaeota archaeon]
MKIKIILMITVLLTVIFLIGCKKEPSDLNTFTDCLTENGAKLFGASWCPHCQQQKDLFGDSFKNLDYTECTEQQQKCSEEAITGLPTWKFADGSIAMGTQELAQLAKKTGCSLYYT